MQPSHKPTVILVHGAWHSSACWEVYFAPWFREQGYTVLCPNLPGHGTPGPKRIPWYSIADYVDSVEALVLQQAGPVVVVGHSMGGHITQKLMERAPKNLVGAGLIASVPPKGVLSVVFSLMKRHPLKLLLSTITFDLYQLLATPELAREVLYTEDCDNATLERYCGFIQNESYRAFMDMLALNLPQPKKVNSALPKWIVGAEHDVLFPPKAVHQTAQAYGTTAKIYPKMAHSSPILEEGWQEVVGDLHKWIRSISAN